METKTQLSRNPIHQDTKDINWRFLSEYLSALMSDICLNSCHGFELMSCRRRGGQKVCSQYEKEPQN